MKRTLQVLFVLLPLISTAQSLQLSSLEQVLGLARKQSAIIVSAGIRDEVAQKDKGLSRSPLLPTLSVNATSDYNLKLPVQLIPAEIFGGPAGTFQQVRFGRSWNSAATADLTVPLIHPEKIAQAKTANFTREQVKLEQEAQVKLALQRVTAVYFNILVLQQALQLNASLDSTATALYNATKAKSGQQLVSRVDLNRTENLMNSTFQQTIQIRTNLEIAKQDLCVLLGISSKTTLEINDLLLNYVTDAAQVTIDPAKRPSYLATEQAEQAAFWAVRQQTYTGLPRLSFNSRYTVASQADKLFNNSAVNFDYGTVGLSLNIPVFKGRSAYLDTKKSRLQLDLARIRKEQQLLDSDNEIQEWQINIREKAKSMDLAARRDKLTGESLELSISSFDQGVITLDQLFNIYNEYVLARNSYLQTMADVAVYRNYLMIEGQ